MCSSCSSSSGISSSIPNRLYIFKKKKKLGGGATASSPQRRHWVQTTVGYCKHFGWVKMTLIRLVYLFFSRFRKSPALPLILKCISPFHFLQLPDTKWNTFQLAILVKWRKNAILAKRNFHRSLAFSRYILFKHAGFARDVVRKWFSHN